MKVGIVARNKIQILRLESRTGSRQDMSSDFPRVVLRRKQIAAHLCRESVAVIERQSTQRCGREERERRQGFTRDRLRRPDIRLKRVQTTFDQVHQGVSNASSGLLKPVVGPDNLSA